MGLKEFFFGRKDEDDGRPRKIVKAEKKITNMYVQTADRQYFLDQLRLDGSPEAIEAMLSRFTCACENTTIDRDEKEMTCQFLVSLGTAAVEPLKKYLKTYEENVNWPFRALKQLLSKDDLIDFLVEILEAIGPEYVRQPERKEQMVLAAKDFNNLERVTRAVVPYLDDHLETIRFITVETLLSSDFDFVCEPLLECLAEEDSQRVITRILEGFTEKGWTVSDDHTESVKAKLSGGFVLSAAKTIQKQ